MRNATVAGGTRRSPWVRTSRAVLTSAALAGSTLAAAGTAAASVQPDAKKQPATVFAVDYAGAKSLLVDKKDQALREALGMLPSRLRELPKEVPGMEQVPAPVIDTALMLLTQPMRMAVTFDADRQDEGMFGLGAVMSFGPGEQEAYTQLHGTVNALLAMGGFAGQGEPSAAYKDMLEVPSPMGGVFRYGPREGKEGWRYEVHAGVSPDPDAVFSTMPAPMAGLSPVARAQMDFRPIGGMIEQNLEAMAGPEGEKLSEMLEGMGVVGPDAIKYVWQVGYTKDEQISTTLVEGMKKHAKTMGVPETPLKDAVFAMIPADASVAAIYQADFSNSLAMIEDALEEDENAGQAIEQFTSATGVDPIKDLLGSLGGTFGFYMSESTGGQLASIIAFASLKDRARFEQAHAKLVGFANTMLASEEAAKGYARVRAWQDGETKLFSLNFPGLPIPAEITWALQGDWVVVGMMPQSTIAATRQIAGKGDKGLRDNKAFASLLPSGKQIQSFSFVDSPRLMKDGYQYVALVGSAIANAVRSPSNPDREPGLVVPPLTELRAGARPMVSYAYWQGDDYVTESHADRSFLVNATGLVGAAAPLFPVIAILGAGAASQQSIHGGMTPADLDLMLIMVP